MLVVERIARFGVDAPFIDEWSLVDDLGKYSRGSWTADDLLRSHNGHRIALLRLVLVPLAFLTGWNARVEMFLGLGVALGTFLLLAHAMRRTLGRGGTAGFCLVLASVSTFSLSQWENWTWGFQVNVALALFLVVLTLTLLSEPGGPFRFAAAIVAAVAATFSQGAGVMVWPAGVLSLLLAPVPTGVRRRRLGLWVALAAAVLVFYAWPRPADAGAVRPSGFPLAHPFAYLRFVLTLLGAPVVSFTGSPWPPREAGVAAVVAIAGIVVTALSWRALPPGVREWWRGLSPFVAVAFWSMSVAAQIGLGRAEAGPPMAMSSRYMAFTSPFWVVVATSLALVSIHRARLRVASRVALSMLGASLTVGSLWHFGAFEDRWRMLWPGLAEIRMRDAPDSVVALFHPEVRQVRERIHVLRQLRLSFFREGFSAPPPARPLPVFDQLLTLHPPLVGFTAGGTVRQRVDVTNASTHRWSALGRGSNTFERAVLLSYHWLTPDGETVVQDGLRTELPRDLLPGERAALDAAIRAPEAPGRFRLRLTMVQEGVAWFDAQGARPLDLPIDVAASR